MWGSDRSRNIYNSQPSRDLVITYCGGATSGESSGSEFVEEEKPWPPDEKSCRPSRSLLRHVPRVPRPHSHLFRTSGGRARGSKHSRRWENSMFLSSLHDIPEEEYEAAATILPLHDSPFSRLHNSDKYMQIWCSFTSHSEEEQEKITRGREATPATAAGSGILSTRRAVQKGGPSDQKCL